MAHWFRFEAEKIGWVYVNLAHVISVVFAPDGTARLYLAPAFVRKHDAESEEEHFLVKRPQDVASLKTMLGVPATE